MGVPMVPQGTGSVLFHYDQAGQLIAETDATGNMVKAYVWLHGQPLAMIDGTGVVYYFHNDHLGTPHRLTDASGGVVWAADYLPFGEVDVTVESVVNNLRFAGQYFDEETGLHYNWNRYYDPNIGRYLRADPIGLKGGINPFVYADNSPINLIDPLGLKWGWGFEGSIILASGYAGEQYDSCCKNNEKVKRTISVQCISFGIILYYQAKVNLPGGLTGGGSKGGFGHCGESSWTTYSEWNVGGDLFIGGKDSKSGWRWNLGLGGYVKMSELCSYTVTKEKPTGECCSD